MHRVALAVSGFAFALGLSGCTAIEEPIYPLPQPLPKLVVSGTPLEAGFLGVSLSRAAQMLEAQGEIVTEERFLFCTRRNHTNIALKAGPDGQVTMVTYFIVTAEQTKQHILTVLFEEATGVLPDAVSTENGMISLLNSRTRIAGLYLPGEGTEPVTEHRIIGSFTILRRAL